MGAKYDTSVDRKSAQEILAKRAAAAAAESADAGAHGNDDDLWQMDDKEFKQARRYNPDLVIKTTTTRKSSSRSSGSSTGGRGRQSDTIVEAFGKSLARQLGTRTGQELVRGVLGSLFRGR